MKIKGSRFFGVSLGFGTFFALTFSTCPAVRAETATKQQWREHSRSIRNEVRSSHGSARSVPRGTALSTQTTVRNGKVLVTVRRARGRIQPPAGFSGCRAYRRSGYFKTFLCNAPVSPSPPTEPVQVQAVAPQIQAPANDPDGGPNPVLPTSSEGDLQSLINTCIQPLQSRPRNIGEARGFCNSLRSIAPNHPIQTNCTPLCRHLGANPTLPNTSPLNVNQSAQRGTTSPPPSAPTPQQNRAQPTQSTANSIPPALLPQVRACVQAIRSSSFIPNSYIPQTVGAARSNCRGPMAGSAPSACRQLCPLVQPGGQYANLPDATPVPQN